MHLYLHKSRYEVEDMIRETLKREMRTWRAKRKYTAFNADVSHRLTEALPELERQANGLTHFDAERHRCVKARIVIKVSIYIYRLLLTLAHF